MEHQAGISNSHNVEPANSLSVQGTDELQNAERCLYVQRKLSIGAVDDPMEHEADLMADKVMRMPDTNFIQRKCAHCEEEESEKVQRKPLSTLIQRKENGSGSIASETVSKEINSSKGSGSVMDSGTRSFMESRFGTDFSGVNIHTGSDAIQMSRSLDAKAFTQGSDIYFNEGQYQPGSAEGNHLLAHELTHTIQQGATSLGSQQIVQRAPFTPWPGQTGEDVKGTFSTSKDGVISERVQRTDDPRYAMSTPSLLEFNPNACTVTATLEINFIPETNAANKLPDAEFTELKKRIIDLGNSKLNGWVFLKAGDTNACPAACKGKDIAVQIIAREGSGPNADTVTLGKSYDREDAGHIGKSASDWTVWHEMGHIVLGAADEYSEKGRPDEHVNESDFSIMAGSSSYGRRGIMHARHFSHIAAWLNRKFAGCNFQIVEKSVPLVVDWNFAFFAGGAGGKGPGLLYSTGVDLGIPLDKLRRLSIMLGPRLTFNAALDGSKTISLLAGFRAGLRYQSTGGIGLHSTLFAEGGGAGFTDLKAGKLGVAPYGEGGASLGIHFGNTLSLTLEGAVGQRTLSSGSTTDSHEYYRFGFGLGYTFK